MNGTQLEFYSYYASGRVRFKDIYNNVGGVWTWSQEGEYQDSGGIPWGDWLHWNASRDSGAPYNYTLPDKPESGDGTYTIPDDILNEIIAHNAALAKQKTETNSIGFGSHRMIGGQMSGIMKELNLKRKY